MGTEEIVRALRNCDSKESDCLSCGYCKRDYSIARDAADLLESKQARITELEAQLLESQRRERAAVEDLNGTGACFTCKHFRRNGGDCFGAGRCRLDGIEIWPCNKPGVYRAEVPDDGRQTYEWRGPQSGEGETE